MSSTHTTGRHGTMLDDDALVAEIERQHDPDEPGATTGELAEAMGFSDSTVARHCSDLEAQGRVQSGWRLDNRPLPIYKPADGNGGDGQ